MKTSTYGVLSTLLIVVVAISLGAGTAAPSAKAATPEATAALGDPGRQWIVVHELDVNHATTVAGFIDENFGITAGYAGETHYTTDGGQSWPKATNASMCRFGLDLVSKDLLWTVGNGGNVRVSTDQGQTWQAVTNLVQPSSYISFVDRQNGWAGYTGQVWGTSDGGQTWTEITIPKAAKDIVATLDLRTVNNGYLFTYTGLLYTTADGGKTWTSQKIDLGDRNFDLDVIPALRFVDAQNGAVVLKIKDGGLIALKTADGGQTWQEEAVPVSGMEQGVIYLSHDGAMLTVTLAAVGAPKAKVFVVGYQKKAS
jgi:photosystem II stability/assembly factor-like uncharacterized protein